MHAYARGINLSKRGRYAIYVLVSLSFFLPALTETPFDQRETSQLILEVIETISETFSRLSWVSPLIHVTTLILLGLLFVYGRRIGRVLDVYFAALFVFMTLSNNIADTEGYGLVVLLGNLVPMLIVALLWVREACKPVNEYSFSGLPSWRYWVVPLAVLAFWFPMGSDYGPNFDPLLLLTSDYGIFFCPTTPVILSIMTLIFPRVDRLLLSVTGLVGLILGLLNALTLFIDPTYTTWIFVLHIPLILVSLYALLVPKIVRTEAVSAQTQG